MTSKEICNASLICHAVSVVSVAGHSDYESALQRIQDEDMLNRDLGRHERDIVRAMFGLGREISETEQCG